MAHWAAFGGSGDENQCSQPKCPIHANLTNRTIEHFRVFAPYKDRTAMGSSASHSLSSFDAAVCGREPRRSAEKLDI
jgi:hypothetical protein